jgi:hypothetical protein
VGKVFSGKPGLECHKHHCSHRFAHGTFIRLYAKAAIGWHFVNWSGACSGKSCYIQMKSARHVIANFGKGMHPHAHHKYKHSAHHH